MNALLRLRIIISNNLTLYLCLHVEVLRMTPSCCTPLCILGTTVGLWVGTWWETTRLACQMEPPDACSSSGKGAINWCWTGLLQQATGSSFRWVERSWGIIFGCHADFSLCLQSIPSYDTIVQTTSDSWHIPYDDTEDRSTYEVPQRWLCLTKKPWSFVVKFLKIKNVLYLYNYIK